jgi:RimJ/RimL family protein N-acetyltransferase
MLFITPITLKGKYCELIPLLHEHHDELVEAVKDGAFWKAWYTLVPPPEKMKSEIDRRLNLQKQGAMLPFSIRDMSTQKIVGMTTFLNIEPKYRRVEIGATWIRKNCQRTGINTEAKILLLTHAFEKLDCIAVEFRTHFFNTQSRRGIERLGAKLDGILRNHMIMPDNTLRDTCIYSIISNEWNTVKTHLIYQLNKER